MTFIVHVLIKSDALVYNNYYLLIITGRIIEMVIKVLIMIIL